MSEADAITPRALAERLRAGERVSVVDVRDRDEFETWRVDGPNVTATQVPENRFVQAEVTGGAADLVDGLDEPVVAVCGRGEASDYAAELLRGEGVDAVNLAGGMEAWANVVLAAEVPTGGPATVLQYQRSSSGCLGYLVHDGERAAVVDPLRAFADRYVEHAVECGLDLVYAVDTHVHADHVSGIRAVAERSDADPVLPSGAEDRGLAFDATLLDDGDDLALGDATLSALHAPGHTSEMTALRVDDAVLAGDSLFLDAVARPDLEATADPEAAAATLYDTIHERLLALPDETLVAPGHYELDARPRTGGAYAAPVGDLRESVPALSMAEDEFVAHVAEDLPAPPANHERIVAINLGRESADDETAFELELGPNNCAAG
ncbi:MBL fold metallo-hydrolase [Halostella sp. JP-L12]|uniref:MBL fold metallo-hydrolase n=1 Tax=Halostella TaxID=1843185 RepID=UPI000EF813C4|nr:MULTISPECIES: MBL fold metallo-hydrolase [Halostella]NHN47688.1 MBL fold metallo-hydrolase [Halostella sp. JP-L12]